MNICCMKHGDSLQNINMIIEEGYCISIRCKLVHIYHYFFNSKKSNNGFIIRGGIVVRCTILIEIKSSIITSFDWRLKYLALSITFIYQNGIYNKSINGNSVIKNVY